MMDFFDETVGDVIGFDIGDRVECILDHPDDNENIVVGCQGTVCHISDCGEIGVCWDERVEGHDCDGNSEYGHGWYVHQDYIKVIESEGFDIDEDAVGAFFAGIKVRG